MVRRLVSGFTLIHLKENFVHLSDSQSNETSRTLTCQYTTTPDGMLYADCVARDFSSFPRTILDTNTQILNISENPIETLEADDLSSFPELTELVMCNLHPITFSPDFLEPLKKLEILNISFTPLASPAVKLPDTIKVLYAARVNPERTEVIALDLSQLIHLEHLSLVNNGMKGFPIIDPKCPLQHIDLQENPITNVEYIDVAPFCKLQWFGLEKYADAANNADKCCNLLVWLHQYDIGSELHCGPIEGKQCDINKKFEFSQKATDLYDECLKAPSSSGNWFLIAVYIIVLVALCSIFIIVAIKYFRSSSVHDHEHDHDHDHHREAKTHAEGEADAHEEEDEHVVMFSPWFS